MAKTITVAGERLTEAQQGALELVATRANVGRCTNPLRGEESLFYRMARSGLIYECGFEDFSRTRFYVPTLHGKGVAAALAATKKEASNG